MSSGFNSSEPVRTIVQHEKPGLRWNLTWIWCGSTLPNLVEPLSSRGNKDHKIISHEFGVIQLFRTYSNHSSTREPKPAVELDRSSELWFEQVRKSWTTPNSWEIVVWSLFPLELMRNYPMILVPSRAQWRKSWTTPTKPRRTSELQREQGSYDKFSWVRGCSTLPNLFEPQETRPAVELDMHSGCFNSSETVQTIAQHRKPDLWWKLTWVRGGSTLPNLFEPLSSRGNKDHRIISHVWVNAPIWYRNSYLYIVAPI